MKQLPRIKFLIKLFLFFGILLFLLYYANYILRSKENTDIHDNFMALERDSIDTIFIGTSHQFCSINTDLLYDEYGINSFMLATSGQTVPMSYYAALEAIEYQHPDIIIMEALYCSNDFRELGPAMSHMFFDGMPNTDIKKQAVEDLIPKEEQIYYYLPLGYYHARWKELTEMDFQSNRTKPRGSFFSQVISPAYDYEILPKSEKEPMPEEMEKYMDMIIELCRENNVELILYTAPFGPLYDDEYTREDLYRRQRIFNWLEDYAAEKEVEYHNLFHHVEELGLDNHTDFMDSQHVNVTGQEKITRYMAEKGYIR